MGTNGSVGRSYTPFEQAKRMMRYRLFVPLQRGWKLPQYTARGVAVGMFWAMTPLVGIQMPLTLVTWLLVHRLFKWEFNLLVAFAWTWVSNVFTMLPMYYAFYLTGQVMLGRWDDLSGYNSFVAMWETAFAGDMSLLDTTVSLAGLIAREQGAAMMVGCLPHAAFFGWLSYRWSMRYLLAAKARKRRKREAALNKALD